MAAKLNLDLLSPEHVTFAYSPLREVMRSLHVIADCQHHPLHIPWVLQARKKMSPALKAEVQRFEFLYTPQTAIFWDLWPPADFRSFDDELEALSRGAVADYAEPVLTFLAYLSAGRSRAEKVAMERFLGDAPAQQQLLARIKASYPRSLSVVEELFANPEQSRDHFCDFLGAYWKTCMSGDWDWLEQLLLADITSRGQVLFQGGIFALLDGLSPELVMDRQTATVSLAGSAQSSIRLNSSSHLFLSPSYFVWPHFSLVVRKQETSADGGDATEALKGAVRERNGGAGAPVDVSVSIQVTYSVKDVQDAGRAPVPPEQLLKMLRATGDMTRLQILQLLGQQPRSTREIAGLIGISDAAISKHLKILQAAGWLTTQRNSYYVMYCLNRAPLFELTRGLQHAIRGAGAGAEVTAGDTDGVAPV